MAKQVKSIVVTDTETGIEKTVSAVKDVITFMVVQTNCLLIRNRLSNKEYAQLEELENSSNELVLLNRFKVISGA